MHTRERGAICRSARRHLHPRVRLPGHLRGQGPGNGQIHPVPSFEPSSDDHRRVWEAAESRIELRKAIEEEMEKQTYDGPSDAPRMINRFLAKPTDVNWGGKVHRHRHGVDR